MAETILERKAKALVPVRDLRDILASFEKLWRQTSRTSQIGQEKQHYFQFQTIEGRCNVWVGGDQPVGLAFNRIKDALHRGFRDRMHFVHYQKLTANPQRTLREIYDFLEEPQFTHDFDNVQQITWEDDLVHGIKGLHDIRPKVEPTKSQYLKVIGAVAADAFKGPFPWDNL
jgi:sulfotransferase